MQSLYKREPPESQDSCMSAASSTFSAPRLPSSSSNLSTSTAGDTEITSPPLSKASSVRKTPATHAVPASPSRVDGYNAPRIHDVNAPSSGHTAVSPRSMESPATQGRKRTADGSPKSFGPTVDASAVRSSGHKRTKSIETGSSARIGQVYRNPSKSQRQ